MDDLVVNNQLSATVVDDKCSNTATTIVERSGDLGIQTTLVNDWETLLDITSLRHANDGTVLTHIKNSVLLEDRSEHALNDD